MAHTQIYYTNSARFASQLAPGSSYETLNLLPSIWQGGGLKSITSINDVGDWYNTNSWIPETRRETGSIIYDRTNNKYYMDNGTSGSGSTCYTELTALTTGSPIFQGLTSSAGILVSGGNISITAGSIYASNIITSSTGFSSVGDLYIGGSTQLGNQSIDTTSIWGNLSLIHSVGNSGSIYADLSGNLILDGSGNSGVQITDGWLFLGASSSTAPYWASGSYTNEDGNLDGTTPAISTSAKVVAKYGFATTNADSTAKFQVNSTGDLQCNSLKETSLRLYKHDIYNIGSPQLDNIAKLKPITFIYNTDVAEDVNDVKVRQAGFIAEQMQQIYPQIVWYKDGKLAGIQYQRLTAYLTKGIQELAEQNKLLKSRVQSLEQLVNGILQGAK